MILIDTDICIEILSGNKKVLKKSNIYNGQISVSFMTVAELYYGAMNSENIEENTNLIEIFLLTVNIIESDFNIMKRFGEIKANLKKENLLLPDADIMIAATTLEHCKKLITGNIKHFKRIDTLQIENWKE